MERTDQTVLMGYDSGLRWQKLYIAYLRYQTRILMGLACALPGHSVMIGIPSYDDVPLLSDPRVENVTNALAGIRAACKEVGKTALQGVALYAHWTTDSREWKEYEVYWLNRLN